MTDKKIDKVLESLPDDWFSKEELKVHINKAFIDHIKVIAEDYDIPIEKEADIARLYELLSEDAKTSIEEIEQSMYQVAHFVAHLTIFGQKFPHIVAEFPIHSSGQSIFPAKVLAKVLDIDESEAKVIAQNYWSHEANPDIN